MKLRHMQSREGRRGGKYFQNGPMHYLMGIRTGVGVHSSTHRRDHRAHGGAGKFHGSVVYRKGRPGWAR